MRPRAIPANRSCCPLTECGNGAARLRNSFTCPAMPRRFRAPRACAASAVCRIVNVSAGGESLFEVEVYAEGDVRHTARATGPQASDRAIVRAPEVKMEYYQRDGINALRSPPSGLDILMRSGFLAPPRTANPPAPQAARVVAAGPRVPVPPPLEAIAVTDPSVSGPRPKVDPMVVTAQMTRDRPPGPDDPADDQGPDPTPGAPGAAGPASGGAGQVPRSGGAPPSQGGAARSPAVDLPPIEGPPGIDVPALPANPEDQLPSVEALPPPSRAPRGRRPMSSRRRYRRWRFRSSPAASASRSSTPAAGVSSTSTRWRRHPRASRSTSSETASGSSPTPPASSGSSISKPTRPSSGAPEPEEGETLRGPNGEYIEDANRHPMEVYLEGNVILRQDQRKWAGRGDQRTLRAAALLQLPH